MVVPKPGFQAKPMGPSIGTCNVQVLVDRFAWQQHHDGSLLESLSRNSYEHFQLVGRMLDGGLEEQWQSGLDDVGPREQS